MADGREGGRSAGRIGDDGSEGEFSSAADANAKVNLEHEGTEETRRALEAIQHPTPMPATVTT